MKEILGINFQDVYRDLGVKIRRDEKKENTVKVITICLKELFERLTPHEYLKLMNNISTFKDSLRAFLNEISKDIGGKIYFKFKNLDLFEEFSTKIKSAEKDTFMKIEGEVVDICPQKARCIFFDAKCKSCGDLTHIQKFNLIKSYISEVFTCDSCNVKSQPLSIENIHTILVQKVFIKREGENFVWPLIFFEGEVDYSIGDKIQCLGEIKHYRDKQRNYHEVKFKTYFEVYESKQIEQTNRLHLPLEELVEKSFNNWNFSTIEKYTIFGCFLDYTTDLPIRKRSHLLIVGEQNTGKTELLNEISRLSANTIQVDGHLCSPPGLTISFAKDKDNPEESFSARGALLKANKGVILIDDIDAMPLECLRVFYTPMESGEVYISKAHQKENFSSDVSVIATMRPSSLKNRSIINLPEPLLSRFDKIIYLKKSEKKFQASDKLHYDLKTILKKKQVPKIDNDSIWSELYSFLMTNTDFHKMTSEKSYQGARYIGNILRAAMTYFLLTFQEGDSPLELLLQGTINYLKDDLPVEIEEVFNKSMETEIILILTELKKNYRKEPTEIDIHNLFIKFPNLNKVEILILLNRLVERQYIEKKLGKYILLKDPSDYFQELF